MNILEALKSEASKLQKQLNSVNSAIGILGGKNGVGRVKGGKKRRLSASARARIARAQRARWAKERAEWTIAKGGYSPLNFTWNANLACRMLPCVEQGQLAPHHCKKRNR